jgi:hypothetical protein
MYLSPDGLSWDFVSQTTNPVVAPSPASGVNTDPDMVLVGGTPFIYYREQPDGVEKIFLKTTTDGVTASASQLVIA